MLSIWIRFPPKCKTECKAIYTLCGFSFLDQLPELSSVWPYWAWYVLPWRTNIPQPTSFKSIWCVVCADWFIMVEMKTATPASMDIHYPEQLSLDLQSLFPSSPGAFDWNPPRYPSLGALFVTCTRAEILLQIWQICPYHFNNTFASGSISSGVLHMLMHDQIRALLKQVSAAARPLATELRLVLTWCRLVLIASTGNLTWVWGQYEIKPSAQNNANRRISTSCAGKHRSRGLLPRYYSSSMRQTFRALEILWVVISRIFLFWNYALKNSQNSGCPRELHPVNSRLQCKRQSDQLPSTKRTTWMRAVTGLATANGTWD